MTPGSFDPETSREMTGDARARKLEAHGRALADAGKPFEPYPRPDGREPKTYWDQARAEFEYVVAKAAYQKRLDRIARKASQA